ncbi:sugar phosphate isomerase/epimerase family protein [Entomohabitans teleogrylli]|uniref:sugar phosphate isomerase/epimerase family protein n=1 Tax=Entomohabitans teleogrylli TaxID=1384589 RepID=UPI00073DAA16|nr:hypothetical protein [Entomohabitans teleogrylli]
MQPAIFVVASAYGYATVRHFGGQQPLLAIVAASGADGIEIRRELLDESELEGLSRLQVKIADNGLLAHYSAPLPLFQPDGSLNPQLPSLFGEAQRLRARQLKLALGHFSARSLDDLEPLARALNGQPFILTIENDQTSVGGSLAVMNAFFHEIAARSLPVKHTFDMANWCWVEQPALEAAAALCHWVSYIHVKVATWHYNLWRATPPDEQDASWKNLLRALPRDVPRGIEYPLAGSNLAAVTRHHVELLRSTSL